MANLAWRSGSYTANITFGVSSLACTAPAGVAAGDLLVAMFSGAVIAPSAAPTITLPAGWTSIRTDTQALNGGALNGRITIAYKVATGSDSFTFSTSANAALAGTIGCWDNPDQTTPFDEATRATVTEGTSFAAPGITTTAANQLLVYFAAGDDAGQTWSRSDGMTERQDNQTTIADVIQAAAGASGNKTATSSTTSTGACYLVAFFSEAALAGTAGALTNSGRLKSLVGGGLV